MEHWGLDPNQLALVIASAGRTRRSARDLAIVTLCIDAGLRRREVVAVRRADLDRTQWTLSVGDGTTRRVIRLGHRSALALQDLDVARPAGDALLVSQDGRAVTARVVHEQLKRAGELAGLGQWLTCRHLRRTYLGAIAELYPLPVVMRLMGHAGDARHRPASILEASDAQFDDRWVSPLDALLSEAAGDVALAA